MANSGSFEDAVSEWSLVLGAEFVELRGDRLDRLSRTTFASAPKPIAVLRPEDAQQVSAILRIASKHRIPVYPISRGRNWGYGDACPAGPNQVILDLGRMNRILEVNATLAYTVIEPGVTQKQLSDYLKDHQLPLWLDVTGAGPDASVVGNTLERGFGHTPMGDHFHCSACYEVVLADGRIIKTGFGRYPGARAEFAYKPGVGPTLDGLFTQSNFGVVTKMGVWLNAAPEYLQGFAFKVGERNDLIRVVDALRPLRLQGILTSAIHIANDLRVISARERYPYDRTGGATPLPSAVHQEMRRQSGLGAWNVIGAYYGTKDGARMARRELKRATRGLAHVHFFNERLLDVAVLAGRFFGWTPIGRWLKEIEKAIRPAYELLKGQPNDAHLLGAGWRSRRPLVNGCVDPLDNDWGLYWLSPVVPMEGAAALELLNMMEPIYAQHGFEPLITMTSITPRALCCVATVAFDKLDPEQTLGAKACYDHLLETVWAEGFIPYRLGTSSMDRLGRDGDATESVLAAIKQALDPEGVISPGRYLRSGVLVREAFAVSDDRATTLPWASK